MADEYEVSNLGGVANVRSGYAFRSDDMGDTGHPIIKIKNVAPPTVDVTDCERVPDYVFATIPNVERYAIQPGDILIAMTGATVGKVGRFPFTSERFYLNQRVGKVYLTEPGRADYRFLYYVLSQDTHVREMFGIADGSAQANISGAQIERLEVPLPPLDEQRAITHILGTLDDKIELNRRMNETLEKVARALFKSWFVDFDPVRAKFEGRDPGLPSEIAALFPDSYEESELGEIPKGWRVGVLDQLTEVVLGGDWGADEPAAGRSEPSRCIRGADIPSLQSGGTGKMPLRFLKPSSLEKRRLDDGDLVVEISGGSPTQSTGRPVLVSSGLLRRLDAPLVCSNFCRLLKLNTPATSKFVYLWLRSLYANDEFLQFENGTTGIKNFAFTLFSSSFQLCIPRPEVMEVFDQQITALFDKEQATAAEADTLAALRDTLLPKLISGELRVGDGEKLVEGEM